MRPGDSAPDFELPDLNGQLHALSNYRGRLVILNFWSCECPHAERTDHDLMAMLVQWQPQVVMVCIASNRNESPAAIVQAAAARRLPVVLRDAEQVAANLYEAQTTPHVFLLDGGGRLRYSGAVDDVSFHQKKPTRFFLEQAVEALLKGQLPVLSETPPFGCTIVREI
jgi:peroxiredoxin